jgi:hypothetical protein
MNKPGVLKKQKKAGARNSSLCETAFHLENLLQTYKRSAISPKPRFREEKNSYYNFYYNHCPDFCKQFFKVFRFFSRFFYFSAILTSSRSIIAPLQSARAT